MERDSILEDIILSHGGKVRECPKVVTGEEMRYTQFQKCKVRVRVVLGINARAVGFLVIVHAVKVQGAVLYTTAAFQGKAF